MLPFPFEEQIVRGIFEAVNRAVLLRSVTVFFGLIVPWIIGAWFLFSLSFARSFKLKFYYFALAALGIILSRGIITGIARNFFYSSRPFEFFDIAPIISHASTSGMPSGHMAFFTPLVLTLILMNKKFGIFATALVILVGTARVAGGAHWISDVLAGIVIGVIGFLIAKAILPQKLSIGYSEPAKVDESKLLI